MENLVYYYKVLLIDISFYKNFDMFGLVMNIKLVKHSHNMPLFSKCTLQSL